MKFKEHILPDIKMFHSAVPGGRREYREHHHTECELSVLLSGSGVYTVKGMEYAFQTGDIFLFGSNEVHCITEISPNSDFELLNIQFEPKFLWNGSDRSALPLLKIFVDRSPAFSNRLDRENPSTPQIRNLILEMEEEFCSQKPGRALKLKLNLLSILLSVLRDYGYINEKSRIDSNDQALSRLAQAMTYIDIHLSEPLRLEEIARQSAMSKAYFSTMFKKYNGLSPWDYITIKRVEMAIEMLEKTDFTKLEIATLCGFNSSANFYKAFARITGKKPGDYSCSKEK